MKKYDGPSASHKTHYAPLMRYVSVDVPIKLTMIFGAACRAAC